MNKESIYRLIGYQGKYTDSVKKALRKLLKENHPDLHGNSELFQIINEVKKELENNQVSFKYSKNDKKYDDIDYEYCRLMVSKKEKEKKDIEEELQKQKIIYKGHLNNYQKSYQKEVKMSHYLLNSEKKDVLKKIRLTSVLFLGLLIITFVLAIIYNSTLLFVTFGVMSLVDIIFVYRYFSLLEKISKKSQSDLLKYLEYIHEMSNINREKEDVNQEIIDLSKKLEKVKNDLRFYENLLK